MGIFYGFLNALSVFLLVFSLFFIFLFKRWSKREISRIEEKKKEVEEILLAADQMINELNRFSDYLITNIGEKSLEVEKMVISLEERINYNKNYIKGVKTCENNSNKEKIEIANTVIPFNGKVFSAPDPGTQGYTGIVSKVNENKLLKQQANMSKSMQILQLAQKGLNETEIAKKLNVGKGEIQLVLGMNKGIIEA